MISGVRNLLTVVFNLFHNKRHHTLYSLSDANCTDLGLHQCIYYVATIMNECFTQYGKHMKITEKSFYRAANPHGEGCSNVKPHGPVLQYRASPAA